MTMDYAVHPIETIREAMEYKFGDLLIYKLDLSKTCEILLFVMFWEKAKHEKVYAQVSKDLAEQLEESLGIPKSLLLNMQKSYNETYGIEP